MMDALRRLVSWMIEAVAPGRDDASRLTSFRQRVSSVRFAWTLCIVTTAVTVAIAGSGIGAATTAKTQTMSPVWAGGPAEATSTVGPTSEAELIAFIYDDSSNLVRASARLGAGCLAPQTARAAAGSVDDALSGLAAGRSTGVRVVGSADELDDVFAGLSRAGSQVESTYPGKLVRLPDGTSVGLRGASRSGGPTIDVRLPDGSTIKVHVDPWPPAR